MRFTGLVKNDRFIVGCTGRTVHVLDPDGRTITKFKDIPYGYRPLLCPGTNLLVVKSTAGWLAFYDLDRLELIRKIRFSKEPAQDAGLCFSIDGRYLYNLEQTSFDLGHGIIRYDTLTLESKTIVPVQSMRRLIDIRYSKQTQNYCVLGVAGNEDPLVSEGPFVAQFDGQHLVEIISVPEYDDYSLFMQLTAN